MLHIGKIELNHDGEAKVGEINAAFDNLWTRILRVCGDDEYYLKASGKISEAHALIQQSMASLPANQKNPVAVALGEGESEGRKGKRK